MSYEVLKELAGVPRLAKHAQYRFRMPMEISGCLESAATAMTSREKKDVTPNQWNMTLEPLPDD